MRSTMESLIWHLCCLLFSVATNDVWINYEMNNRTSFFYRSSLEGCLLKISFCLTINACDLFINLLMDLIELARGQKIKRYLVGHIVNRFNWTQWALGRPALYINLAQYRQNPIHIAAANGHRIIFLFLLKERFRPSIWTWWKLKENLRAYEIKIKQCMD